MGNSNSRAQLYRPNCDQIIQVGCEIIDICILILGQVYISFVEVLFSGYAGRIAWSTNDISI